LLIGDGNGNLSSREQIDDYIDKLERKYFKNSSSLLNALIEKHDEHWAQETVDVEKEEKKRREREEKKRRVRQKATSKINDNDKESFLHKMGY
jgi:hypothetical protein